MLSRDFARIYADFRRLAKPFVPRAMLDAYRRVLRRVRRERTGRRYAGRERSTVFRDIYGKNRWGDASSVSGSGSNLAATEAIRHELPPLLKRLGARTLLDAPCGDFNWMRDVDLPCAKYIGADIVPDLIAELNARYADRGKRFLVLDVCRDALPASDVILCRDCFVHLSFEDAFRALRNFKQSGATWLIATTFPACRRNEDIVTGSWRPLNLALPPFSLPAPAVLIDEKCAEGAGQPYRDKALGVWSLHDLPVV